MCLQCVFVVCGVCVLYVCGMYVWCVYVCLCDVYEYDVCLWWVCVCICMCACGLYISVYVCCERVVCGGVGWLWCV